MKSIILPSLFLTSFNTALSLSSNSPLYLAPAIREPISRANIVLSFKLLGTSSLTILSARPSAIAVLENTEETSAKPEQPDDDNPNKDDDKTEVDTQKPDGDNPNKDDGKTESELQKPQKPGGNIQTDGKDAEATDHTPKTADESMLLEMVLVFLASLGASVCILVYDKKEKQ